MRQHQHGTSHEQTAVEMRLQPDADGDGQWDNERAHCNVRQRQRDDEVKGRVPQRAIYPHSPDHHDIPDDRGEGDHYLHTNVESLRVR